MNDPWLRRFLYWCLVLGHAQAAAAKDPLELVAGAMQYELVDPYVRAEITRRGVQHPAGMHAWMLVPKQRVLEATEWAPDQHVLHEEQLRRLQDLCSERRGLTTAWG